MKNWIVLMLSFFLKSLGGRSVGMSPTVEFKEYIRENAMKVALGLTIIVAVGTMFSIGIIVIVSSFSEQADRNMPMHITLSSMTGFAFVTLSSIFMIILFALSNRREKRGKHRMEEEKAAGPSPIEGAIALLINDIVKEREAKREAMASRHERARTEEEMYGPGYKSPSEFERH